MCLVHDSIVNCVRVREEMWQSVEEGAYGAAERTNRNAARYVRFSAKVGDEESGN